MNNFTSQSKKYLLEIQKGLADKENLTVKKLIHLLACAALVDHLPCAQPLIKELFELYKNKDQLIDDSGKVLEA